MDCKVTGTTIRSPRLTFSSSIEYVPLLHSKRKEVHDKLMKANDNVNGALYFLDGPGVNVETFLMSIVFPTVRSKFHYIA